MGPARAGLRPVLAMLSAMPDDGTGGFRSAAVTAASGKSTAGLRSLLASAGLGDNAEKLAPALAAMKEGDTERARTLIENWRETATSGELLEAAIVLGRLGAADPSMQSETNGIMGILAGPTAALAPRPTVAEPTRGRPVLGSSAAVARLGEEGESCTRTAECVDPLGCIGGVCRPRARDVERDRVAMLAGVPTELWPCAALVSSMCTCDHSPAGTGRCAAGIDIVNATVGLQACLVALEPRLTESACASRPTLLATRAAFTVTDGRKLVGVRPEAVSCGQQVRRICTCVFVGGSALQRETCRMGVDGVLAAADGQAAPACAGNSALQSAKSCAGEEVASVFAPASVPSVPAPPTSVPPTQVQAPAEPGGLACSVAGSATVKLRADASHVAVTTGTALPGAALACYEVKAGWRRVRVLATGVRGYLPENYLRFPAPPAATPQPPSAPPPPLAAPPTNPVPVAPTSRPPDAVLRQTCEALYRDVMVRKCGAVAGPAAYVDKCVARFCVGTGASTCALEVSRTCNWDRILNCPACR